MEVTNHRQIPGFFCDEDYAAVERIVALLPDSGRMIEVGCLMGRSTTGWAEAFRKAGKTFSIHAIDGFAAVYRTYAEHLSGDPELIRQVIAPEHSQESLFAAFTRNYPNISYRKERFSTDLEWSGPLHCVFEDSDHAEATLRVALPFWWDKLDAAGILCGHDYDPSEPGVVKSVDEFAAQRGCTVQSYPGSSVWSIQKPAA